MRSLHPSRAARAAHRISHPIPRRSAALSTHKFTCPATTPLPIRQHSTTTHAPNSSSSVDPTEVSHFNALASSWWDPHGPSRLLHLMNPLRHTFISRCRGVEPTHPAEAGTLRYLDIGCGGGIFAESAARLAHTQSVTAIDPTPEVLRIAEAHRRRDPALLRDGRLTYLNTSIEHLPVPAGASATTTTTSQPQTISAAGDGTTSGDAQPYDVVTIFEVLEHVSAPAPFLELAMQQVRPGGWLILSTIARTWTSWLVTNVMAEDVLGIVPKGTHEWSKYVNESELREWFAKQPGWGQVEVMGVVYVPGVGWKEVKGGEGWGNYFLGVRRLE